MSAARDELARIIMSPESFDGGPPSCGPGSVYAARIADAILAAGYSKPRTIETVEELRGLPDGSVLMSGDRIRRYSGAIWRISDGMVSRVGKELEGVTPFRFFVDPLPATVLHEPAP